jgi:hypothetical protein
MNEVPHYRWSFSSLGLMTCPKQYELVRAKGTVKSEESKAGNEGARLHELIEKYIRDDIWDTELSRWKRVLDIYKAKNGVCEAGYSFKWAYDQSTFKSEPLVYDEERMGGLFRCEDTDPDRWYTGYIDWMKIDGDFCEIADWKTGKVKITKQLQLYAWVVMTAHPEVNKVKVTFHFLNHSDQVSDWFERKDLKKLFEPFKEILEDIDRCYLADVWLENPGDMQKNGRGANCRFCPADNTVCSHGKEVF